ncbi:T9SS type A sorting domain-containing protein [Flavicella sediminum]|uniref:T9SS type A sorting domain-containing protein n=1 Tax=Flavicella sediminum TaxID=2585141 RepID=UPI0011204AB1|nr:T9SS type A sorting domain-containing protein [Flavicella sediminum]
MRNKITLMAMFFLTVTTFAQPIITAIYSGNCTGAVPRGIEIYANGEVDFTLYQFQNQPNGVGFTRMFDMDGLGTKTDEFVYVSRNTGEFSDTTTEFAAITGTETNLYDANTGWVSGDDAVRIVRKSDDVVIDFYGVINEDGTGNPWDYTKGYAKRINGTIPTGAFTIADWNIAKNAFSGKGLCNSEALLSDVADLKTYSTVALSVDHNKSIEFSIYPNPANKEINISSLHTISTINIMDLSGKIIASKTPEKTTTSFDVRSFSPGIYIIQLIDRKNSVSTEKIIIE